MGRPIILLLSLMRKILLKNWLIASFLVLLSVAGWQYWQIQTQAPVGAVPNPIYGGCKQRSFNDCAGCVDDQTACKWDHKTQTCKEKPAPNGCGAGGLNVDNKCPAGCTIDSDKKNLYERCLGGQWCTIVARKCDGGSATGSKGESCSGYWAVGTKGENCRPDPKCGPNLQVSPMPSPSPKVSPSPQVSPMPSPSPSPSPSVSPSPSPLVSPSPVPSPEPGTASFVIRKFKDNDKDGSWDSNETSTGYDWSFRYRFNDGEWQDYTAWGHSGWGGIVSVGQGTKVEVKEIERDGWTNTTGLTLIKILEENQVYYFDFGNFINPGVVEALPPAQAPEAGRGFAFQPWLLVAGLGALLQLAALLL